MNTNTSVLSKLVAVFGVNAVLSAIYTKETVAYNDGTATLAFTVGKDGVEAKEPGQYEAVVKEKEIPQGDVADTAERQVEYELVEKFVKATTAPEAPKTKAKAKQTPSFGFEGRARF